MGNSQSSCSHKNLNRNLDGSSPPSTYPPVSYNYASNNGQIISKEQQQQQHQQLLYKTTIPINEQQRQQQQKHHHESVYLYRNAQHDCNECNGMTGTLQTADSAMIMRINGETPAMATTMNSTSLPNINSEYVYCNNNRNKCNNNVTIGVPLYAADTGHVCCCKTGIGINSNNTTTATQLPNTTNPTNENHTSGKTYEEIEEANVATTTTTVVEYELTNGIAKLCKISSSRNIAEQQSSNVQRRRQQQQQQKQQQQNQQLCLYTKNSPLDCTVIENNSQLSDIVETVVERESCNINTSDIKYSIKNIPLLSSYDLQVIKRNLNAINCTFNTSSNDKSINNYQQLKNNYSQKSKMESTNDMNGTFHGKILAQLPRDRLGFWGTSNDGETPGNISGLERLRNKKYNKGLAFTLEERQLLGIQGLLPAVVKTEQEQLSHCLCLFDRLDNDLDKFRYLNSLSERNERLFYKLLTTNISKMMPIVYTPTVGLACQKYSLIYEHPKGLYITFKDKGHVYEVLRNWPESDIRAIVVTDGERILGLGDLGANGMGIPVGKLALYTALAGVKPNQCLPITLDVGTNNENLLQDPLYIGLRHKRVVGQEYDDFLDEFMQAVVRRYGQNCLIQFEDFANANAFRLLEKYRDDFCTFNDDIQGTACVAVGGLMTSLKITKKQLKENTIVFFGAGEAALGIANLCVMAMKDEGLDDAEARKRIWMIDSKGLIVKNRVTGGLTPHKLKFAQEHESIDTLVDVIKTVKPSVLIGAAARGGVFTKEVLELMAEYNESPIIFALSNPTSKAECTAQDAYTYTRGKCLFASGSPFDPVEYNGTTFIPGQGNNAYVFPGIGLGVICSGVLTIPEEIFLITAKCLANMVNKVDLNHGRLYPSLQQIGDISLEIATNIMEYAFKKGIAAIHPEPRNKRNFVKSQMYDITYPSALPEVYAWNNKL